VKFGHSLRNSYSHIFIVGICEIMSVERKRKREREREKSPSHKDSEIEAPIPS